MKMRIRWFGVVIALAPLACSDSATSRAADGGATAEGGSGADSSAGGLVPCTAGEAGAAHFVVDPKDGKCKLDGTTTNVGAACMASNPTVCGTDMNATCLDPAIDDWPGGYCNVDPCSALDGHLCPVGGSCAQINGENGQCFKNCSTDADCRMSEGYICLDLTADDHGASGCASGTSACWISGASHKVCSRPNLICPSAANNCPAAFPHCVLDNGAAAFPPAASDDGGTVDSGPPEAGASPEASVSGGDAGDGAAVSPPNPHCVK
ncbi:MAG: hypothetical protein M3O50_08200 [Myxococcota bacterium]|nr:hypothetical protein [Myxococcota bacterium]